MDNRRKSQRHPIATIAHVTPHGLQKTVAVQVRDISTHGMGGYVDHPYQKGDLLLVKISLPLSNKEIIKESLMGRISWITQLSEEKQYAFGLEFCEIEKRKPMLYAYLKHLEKLALEEMSRPN